MNLVFYSHSDYSDIWPILFNQTNKYFNSSFNKFLFTNEGDAPKDWQVIYYDDELKYQDRFSSCLEKINCRTIIYHHEDMFLYGQPDINYIKRLYSLIDNYSFVKLIKTGANRGVEVYQNLYELQNNHDYFAIQPSIWRTEDLLNVLKNTQSNSIWEFEVNAGLYCIKEEIKGIYCYNKKKDKPRGGHYDSSVYPYVATAVVKGKWNYKEYKFELEEIFNKNFYKTSREHND